MLLIFICNSKDVTVGADMRRLIGFFLKSVHQWWIYNNWQNLNRLDTWQQPGALPLQVGLNLVRGLLLLFYKYRTPV